MTDDELKADVREFIEELRDRASAQQATVTGNTRYNTYHEVANQLSELIDE